MCKSSGGVHREEDRRDLFNLPLYEHHLVIYTCAVRDVNSQNMFPCWTACTKFISERNVACIPVCTTSLVPVHIEAKDSFMVGDCNESYSLDVHGLCWSPLVSRGLRWSRGVSAGLQGSLLVFPATVSALSDVQSWSSYTSDLSIRCHHILPCIFKMHFQV